MKEKLNLKKISINSILITMLCHTFCCVFPIFGWIIGINIFASILHSYESIFIIINIIAIFIGFYATYIHKIQKKCDHNNCNEKNILDYNNNFTIVNVLFTHFINYIKL